MNQLPPSGADKGIRNLATGWWMPPGGRRLGRWPTGRHHHSGGGSVVCCRLVTGHRLEDVFMQGSTRDESHHCQLVSVSVETSSMEGLRVQLSQLTPISLHHVKRTWRIRFVL